MLPSLVVCAVAHTRLFVFPAQELDLVPVFFRDDSSPRRWPGDMAAKKKQSKPKPKSGGGGGGGRKRPKKCTKKMRQAARDAGHVTCPGCDLACPL